MGCVRTHQRRSREVIWTANHYDERLAVRIGASGLSAFVLLLLLGLIWSISSSASAMATIVALLLYVASTAGLVLAFASLGSDYSPVCALAARALGRTETSDAYQAFAERPYATKDGIPHAVIADQVLASGELRMRLMRAPRDFDALGRNRFDAVVLQTVVVEEQASEDEVVRAALTLAERAEKLERDSSSEPRLLPEPDLDDPSRQHLLLVRSALSQDVR